MLESLNDNNINIKNLSIEDQEREERPWFDPEKDITEEDIEGMTLAGVAPARSISTATEDKL